MATNPNKNEETKKAGGKKVAKGGLYKVLRTTTYKGITLLAGQEIKLNDPDCKNRNLKKTGEFNLSGDFQERIANELKNYEQLDGKITSANYER